MADYTVNGATLSHGRTVYTRGQTVSIEDKELAKRLLQKGAIVQQGDDTKRASQGTRPEQHSSKSERKSSE